MSERERQPAQNVWDAALGVLQESVTRPNFETWLRDTVGLCWNGDTLDVSAPNAFVAEMLEQRMYSLISRAVERVAQREVEVRFVVTSPEGEVTIPNQPSPHRPGARRRRHDAAPDPGGRAGGQPTPQPNPQKGEANMGNPCECCGRSYASRPMDRMELSSLAIDVCSRCRGKIQQVLIMFERRGIGITATANIPEDDLPYLILMEPSAERNGARSYY